MGRRRTVEAAARAARVVPAVGTAAKHVALLDHAGRPGPAAVGAAPAGLGRLVARDVAEEGVHVALPAEVELPLQAEDGVPLSGEVCDTMGVGYLGLGERGEGHFPCRLSQGCLSCRAGLCGGGGGRGGWSGWCCLGRRRGYLGGKGVGVG